MPKKLFSFGQLSPKKIAILGGVVILIIVVLVFVFKNNGSGSSGIKNNLTTLTNWSNTYKGTDTKSTVSDASKFLQLKYGTNAGKYLVLSTTQGYSGTLFLKDDIKTTTAPEKIPSTVPFADIVEFQEFGASGQSTGNAVYMGLTPPTTNTGAGYRNIDLRKISDQIVTAGSGMIQLIHTQFQKDSSGDIYSCINVTGKYFVVIGDICSNPVSVIFGGVDGPDIGNMVTYIKMIELNDGRMLLATREKKLFISPSMGNTNSAQITEALAPPQSRYIVTDFTQLKDGTVVVLLESGDVFVKSAADLTNNGINWTRITAFDNMPVVARQIVELSDNTIVAVGSDGYLHFLS